MKVDYNKTFIYKLCCNDINIKDIYVGHSTDFKSRNQDHKKCCKYVNSKKNNAYKYQFIRDNGGYENWKMIKLYDFPCNSKREAEAEEDKTMRELNATLNSYRAFLTEEERIEYYNQYDEKRKNNPERIEYKTKHNKEYREKNQEYLKKYDKERNEKVKCEFCNCEIGKRSLKRHQKSMKCLKFQKCIIDDE
tara:strand:- start:202 stop:777 length:576 start_codon:yes stop_codon:yes gene_type:complete